jgi:hypothetical protein
VGLSSVIVKEIASGLHAAHVRLERNVALSILALDSSIKQGQNDMEMMHPAVQLHHQKGFVPLFSIIL